MQTDFTRTADFAQKANFAQTADYPALISEVAHRHFKIDAVKPFQMLVMQRILEQEMENYQIRHQIVILPTGTGKSLCFLLPALLCKGITVIVYPLLALMNDQFNKLKANGINVLCLRGGQTKAQREEVFKTLGNSEPNKQAKILITNPETLQNTKLLQRLASFKISLFVCDEAHVIEKWGKSFRPSYLNLQKVVKTLSPKQILAFTATAGGDTLKTIKTCLFPSEPLVAKPLIVRGDSDRENIYYSAVKTADKSTGLYTLIENCEKPALVFCSTRPLTQILCTNGRRLYPEIEQMYYHAGLSKLEREALENWFLASKDGILYSTNAYGMGIDKPNIRTVIHFNLPPDAESYLQESGRAGRDSKQSYAFALITYSDFQNKQDNKTESLTEVFTSDSCIRRSLLEKLGEEKEECSGCSNCTGNSLIYDKIPELLIKTVKRYPFRFNFKTLSEFLCRNTKSLSDKVKIGSACLPYYKIDFVEKSIRNLTVDKDHPFRPFKTIKTPKAGLLLYFNRKRML